MSYISKVRLDDTVYDLKDAEVRSYLPNYVSESNGLTTWMDIDGKGDALAYDEDTSTLSLKSGTNVISSVKVAGGATRIRLADVSGAVATTSKNMVQLTWSDPADVVVSGTALATWEGTRVVRKVGSAPANETDGVVILNSKTRNAYASTPFQDTGLEYNTTYYYRFFPYTVDKVVTEGSTVSAAPARIVISTVPSQSGTLSYTGNVQTASFNNFDPETLDVTGNTGTSVGSYTAIFVPKEGYCWSNGSISGVGVSWSILAAKLTVPTVTNTSKTYNGQPQSPTISSFNTSLISMSGNVATDADDYIVTFSLVDSTSYAWSDDTTSNKTVNWTIAPKTVGIPSLSGSYTYNTSAQNVAISSYDSDEVSVTGDTSATNAGTYTVYFALVDTANYQWTDGTTEQKSATWTIQKASGAATITYNGNTVTSSTNIDLGDTGETATVTIANPTGTVSVSSSATNVATVNYSNGTLTITGGTVDGVANITVNVAATTNYNAYSLVFTLTLSLFKIVTFADGTDEQIVKMLNAYYNNEITWEDMGWAVGDTRKIHLNEMTAPNPYTGTWAAQDITIVIVDHDHTDLATPINGHTKACITVQTRECMNNESVGYHSNTDTLNGHIYVNGDSSYDKTFTKWSNLYMRTYLNSTVLGAIPSGDFKSAIKPSKHNRHTACDTSTSEEVTDTLFLPSYPEIFGTAFYSYYTTTSPVEGTQFKYYETASNRIKNGNNNGSSNGIAQNWWEGSASSDYASSNGYVWCLVATGGSASFTGGRGAGGLAPAFAM